MEYINRWIKGSNSQWIFCTFDNSPMGELGEKINTDMLVFPSADEPINLGIRCFNNQVYSSNFVGVCRLKEITGKNIMSHDGKEVILKIVPRFPVSVVQMIDLIKDDDEFERYLAPQTIRVATAEKDVEDLKKNEVFHFFDKEPPIYITDNIARDSSILTATVFISMLKDLCRRPLMGKMVTTEENLVGKVKGKVLFGKNIRKNTIKGRDDRLYCCYLRYSEDIIENQVLRAALQKASQFLNRYFGSTVSKENSYKEMISYCQNTLEHISLIKISQRDTNSIKVTGCYAYYKPVISVAKMVLNEITLESNGTSRVTNYVVPYAVSMSKLFEMYVRAYLKKSGVLSYHSEDAGIHIKKYDYKSKVFDETGKDVASYIGGVIKPDIILENTVNGKIMVLDVKYKNLHKGGRNARTDRLQLLAYGLMYNCDDIGIVFPSDIAETSFYYEKNKISSFEERVRHYHQIELGISTTWNFEIRAKKDNSIENLYEYSRRLLV